MLREVETLLDQGRAVGAKPLREYMEVTGYAELLAGCTSKRSSRTTGAPAG